MSFPDYVRDFICSPEFLLYRIFLSNLRSHIFLSAFITLWPFSMSYYLWNTMVFPLELEFKNYLLFWLDLNPVLDLLLLVNLWELIFLLSTLAICKAVIICFLLIWLITIPKGRFFGWGYLSRTFRTELFFYFAFYDIMFLFLYLESLLIWLFTLKFWK